jgi:GTP-binding protein HflX
MKDETPDQREQRFEALLLESARAAADYDAADEEMDYGAEQELSERQALRRVKGFSTQLQDISEAEYRELQLERVVLVGVWTEGSIENAENSLTELRALAETAGSEVLDGLIQRRDKPDPATYIGSGKVQELREVVRATGADTVICDGELSLHHNYDN